MVELNMNLPLLTEEGHERLSQKLDSIQEKIRKAREDMSRTAENGDFSENAGYMAAKESYESNRNRLNELEEILGGARVVSPEEIGTDRVGFGTKVTVKDLNREKEFTYRIVGKHEARFDKGEISVESPVAKGLLDGEPGEVVEIDTPRGKTKYEIVDVTK